MTRTIGVVGGGQLGRMLLEAALALDLRLAFYVRPGEQGVSGWATSVVEGPLEAAPLASFANSVDVLTFEHELVDPAILAALEAQGIQLAPGAVAMATGSNKEQQRALFTTLGLPTIPAQLVDRDVGDVPTLEPPYLLKAVRGGYDGRGLLRVDATVELPRTGRWLAEPLLPIASECAVVVARAANGEVATWDPVALVHREGICVEAAWPSGLEPRLERDVVRAARTIADALDYVGVMAVEFFIVEGSIVVNEMAPRVHNSGHLTIEGAVTSQFENHLRAVAGLPLGSTESIGPAVMVNLIGARHLERVPTAARVHRYGKTPRTGRKVGHVTAVAASLDEARQRAWTAARDLGGELLDAPWELP